MASWLDSLFGGCCNRQRPQEPEPSKQGTIVVLPDQPTEEDLRSLPTLAPPLDPGGSDMPTYSLPQSPMLGYELLDEEVKQGRKRRPAVMPFSQRSTLSSQSSASIDSATLQLTQMKCGACGDQSTGFCIGCQKQRFCYTCYQREHSSMHGLHKFISYAGTRRASVRAMKEKKAG